MKKKIKKPFFAVFCSFVIKGDRHKRALIRIATLHVIDLSENLYDIISRL